MLRARGDERGLGRALLALCAVHQLACNLAEVGAAATRAKGHYVASGFSPATCLAMEGDALYFGSTPITEAEARCVELLAEAPDRTSEANLTAVLGALSAAGGRVDDGRSLIAQALATLSELGSKLVVASAVSPLSMEVEVYAGDIEAAIRIGREDFDELFRGGHVAFASTRAVYLADLLLDIGASRGCSPIRGRRRVDDDRKRRPRAVPLPRRSRAAARAGRRPHAPQCRSLRMRSRLLD